MDKQKDAGEIATLQERAKKLQSLPRPITPIAIPLRNGLDLSEIADENTAAAFDADGSGLPRRWTWITPQAGWLVMDPRGHGEVRSALQMFGNVSFWLFWEYGYQALNSLARSWEE